MSLNESILEDAALEWFLLRQVYGGPVGEQCHVAPTVIPAFFQGEKEEDGEVLLVRRLRGAIRRLNPAIPRGGVRLCDPRRQAGNRCEICTSSNRTIANP